MSTTTRSEQETVIRFDEDSPDAIVYTASSRVAKHLDKRFDRQQTFNDLQGRFTGAEYTVPKRIVRIKPSDGPAIYIGGTI